MNVNSLVIEVGRKCNLWCEHCLRGEAQDVTINIQTAKNLIDEFNFIGNITFTGGEPALYAAEIIDIINYIIDNKKSVAGFYIASNGLIFNPELMLSLCKLQAYIRLEFGDEEIEEYSAFDISTDHYHEPLSSWQKALFKGFSFVKFKPDIDDKYLINEGNAYENGIGYRNLKSENQFCVYDDTIEMVYLNALGYLLGNCDFSYDTQDLLNPPLYEPASFKETIHKMAS